MCTALHQIYWPHHSRSDLALTPAPASDLKLTAMWSSTTAGGTSHTHGQCLHAELSDHQPKYYTDNIFELLPKQHAGLWFLEIAHLRFSNNTYINRPVIGGRTDASWRIINNNYLYNASFACL
jgi:hypothetical protein